MISCPSCGALVPDDRDFCPNCGSRIPDGIERAPVRPAMAAASPVYSNVNPAKAPCAVLSVGGFISSIILLSIPALGFILKVVWSCGGCHNHNRRNLARAYLVLWFLITALATGTWFILQAAGMDATGILPFGFLKK
jgi:hypothetical protein